jgi:hypothetical protein
MFFIGTKKWSMHTIFFSNPRTLKSEHYHPFLPQNVPLVTEASASTSQRCGRWVWTLGSLTSSECSLAWATPRWTLCISRSSLPHRRRRTSLPLVKLLSWHLPPPTVTSKRQKKKIKISLTVKKDLRQWDCECTDEKPSVKFRCHLGGVKQVSYHPSRSPDHDTKDITR